MRLDRKGIPKEIKSIKGCEEKSTIYAYQSNGDAMLVSYVDKKKVRKTLSSLQPWILLSEL